MEEGDSIPLLKIRHTARKTDVSKKLMLEIIYIIP